jgi:hypothetical protein
MLIISRLAKVFLDNPSSDHDPDILFADVRKKCSHEVAWK